MPRQLGLPEPDETADSFAGNAALKAHAAAGAAGLPALADDSGFCLGALNGDPGLYSARWAGPGRDFGLAMQRVHDRRSRSLRTPTTAGPGSSRCCASRGRTARSRSFEGRIDGEFAWPPRGSNGHGYDPVFVPDGETRRFAEMAEADKNAISHRARSFRQFAEGCLPTG